MNIYGILRNSKKTFESTFVEIRHNILVNNNIKMFCGVTIGEHYPLPIINLQESSKLARDKIWGHKKHPEVQKEKNRLLNTHVKRRV